MTNTFTFVGKFIKPKDNFIEKKEFSSGWVKHEMRFGMKCGLNVQFLDIQDIVSANNNQMIKTFSKDKEKIEIAWSDRFDQTKIDSVAFYKKNRIDMSAVDAEYGTKEFITKYDFLNAFAEIIKQEDARKYQYEVSGNVDFSYSISKDIYYRNFYPTSIKIISPNSEVEETCVGKIDCYFYGKRFIDSSFKNENDDRTVVHMYTKYYDQMAKKSLFTPFDIIAHDEDHDNNIVKFLKDNCTRDIVYNCGIGVRFDNLSDVIQISDEEILKGLTSIQKELINSGTISKEQMIEMMRKDRIISDSPDGSMVSKNKRTENRFGDPWINAHGISDSVFTLSDLTKKPTDNKEEVNKPTASVNIGPSKVSAVPENKIDDIFSGDDVPFSI